MSRSLNNHQACCKSRYICFLIHQHIIFKLNKNCRKYIHAWLFQPTFDPFPYCYYNFFFLPSISYQHVKFKLKKNRRKFCKDGWLFQPNSDMPINIFFFLPSINAENYHCILLVTKSNKVLSTFNQAELSH